MDEGSESLIGLVWYSPALGLSMVWPETMGGVQTLARNNGWDPDTSLKQWAPLAVGPKQWVTGIDWDPIFINIKKDKRTIIIFFS